MKVVPALAGRSATEPTSGGPVTVDVWLTRDSTTDDLVTKMLTGPATATREADAAITTALNTGK